MHLNPEQKVFLFKYNTFYEFCFYIPTFFIIVDLTSKRTSFSRTTLNRVAVQSLVGDIKTNFKKLAIFKKANFFIQDLNIKVIKVPDFNTNFTITLLQSKRIFNILILGKIKYVPKLGNFLEYVLFTI